MFEPDRVYRPSEVAEKLPGVVTKAKLSQWRHYDRGPAYHKLGPLVVYRGSDLNDWLNANRVEPVKSKGKAAQAGPGPSGEPSPTPDTLEAPQGPESPREPLLAGC